MSFQVRYCTANRIVGVVFFERVDIAENKAAMHQVVEKYGHLHSLRILVDMRLANIEMSIAERQNLGRYAANLADLKRARVAVLLSRDYNAAAVISSTAQAYGLQIT